MKQEFGSTQGLANRAVARSEGRRTFREDFGAWIVFSVLFTLFSQVLIAGVQEPETDRTEGGAKREETGQQLPKDEKELPAARQNALLRNHFREMYPRFAAGGWRQGRTPPANDDFTEHFIDRQIDNYLERIENQLARLESNLAVAEKLRERILFIRGEAGTEFRREYPEALRGFDGALKEVQGSADDLKDQLEFAFSGLRGKQKLEHRIDSSSRENFFEKELRFLRRQKDQAEKRIRNYLFHSVNTVDAKELQEETMLVCLYQVEQMAKEVRKNLK